MHIAGRSTICEEFLPEVAVDSVSSAAIFVCDKFALSLLLCMVLLSMLSLQIPFISTTVTSSRNYL